MLETASLSLAIALSQPKTRRQRCTCGEMFENLINHSERYKDINHLLSLPVLSAKECCCKKTKNKSHHK